MIGILSDYGLAPTFGEWVKYGLPFVPVMALVIATYFYVVFAGRVKIKDVNVAALVRKESEKIGKMTRDEYWTGGVLVLLILLWTHHEQPLRHGGAGDSVSGPPERVGRAALAGYQLDPLGRGGPVRKCLRHGHRAGDHGGRSLGGRQLCEPAS